MKAGPPVVFCGRRRRPPAIDDGTGDTFAWETFSGWVAGQAEYRFDGFESGDTSAGAVDSFELWVTGQEEQRDAFGSGDTSAGTAESFDEWVTHQVEYQPDGFNPGDTTAGAVESFSLWATGQGDYRASFQGGDTTTGSMKTGAASTAAAESFEGCRTDVDAQTTATSTTIAAAGHAFSVGDPVQLLADGALPAPFQKGITYWVKTVSAGVSMTVAATAGGTAITATETGEATIAGDRAYFWRNPRSAW